jgi:hypothetical protein
MDLFADMYPERISSRERQAVQLVEAMRALHRRKTATSGAFYRGPVPPPAPAPAAAADTDCDCTWCREARSRGF